MNPFVYGRVVSRSDFCPRPELESRLKSHILSNQNVLVEGERRSGKTSLIHETVRKIKNYSLIYIDLLEIKDSDELCRRMVKSLLSLKGNLLTSLLKSLAHLRPVISVDPLTGTPSVSISSEKPLPPDSIEGLLDLIYDQRGNKKTVVVFDEFQDILKLSDSATVLSLMRSKIQFQTEMPFIFSGSIRNAMNGIFNDPGSPFFKSAVTMDIGPIDQEDFAKFIQARFATGNREIQPDFIRELFSLGQNAPGDIQQLCAALWDCSNNGDNIAGKLLPRALSLIFGMELKGYEALLGAVSAQQQRCLSALARAGGKGSLSGDFLKLAGISQPASVKKALNRLIDQKVIYRIGDEYKFANPFFRAWLVAENL